MKSERQDEASDSEWQTGESQRMVVMERWMGGTAKVEDGAARARVKKIRGKMGAARWAVGQRAALPAPKASRLRVDVHDQRAKHAAG